MAAFRLTEAESRFTEQRETFLELARARYPDAPESIEQILKESTRPLDPFVVQSLDGLLDMDMEAVSEGFTHGYGVVHIVPLDFRTDRAAAERHELLSFAQHASHWMPLGIPIEHPMERHAEAVRRFGESDGTLKIYDLPVTIGGPRYREQAETNEMFDAHNDGLGYAGLIKSVAFTLDSAPLAGGYTFFQNLVRLAPAIATSDPEAFQALFLPDALTAIRPRGKGAIKVQSPVYFLGRDGEPQTFFRVTTGEYSMVWRQMDALMRTRDLLLRLGAPFGPSSRFVHLMRPGETIVINNRHVVHGRTPFVDAPASPGRVLARKWFVDRIEDTTYRHVPSVYVASPWADLFPEIFSPARLSGDWHYEATRDENVRISD